MSLTPSSKHWTAALACLALACAAEAGAGADGPLPLENRKSGISIGLSGENGKDWAVEQLFHDPSLGDQVIFLTDRVAISLAHNANNSIMHRSVGLPGVIGADGPDGRPHSGDEGDIHWKLDRDMQSHSYTTAGGEMIPDFAPRYTGPIRLGELTYDGEKPVLGSVGDNGGPWGDRPRTTRERFAYGQRDAAGNEWHTLTYWDDDAPIFRKINKSPHRQAASDGHWVYLCVNPRTPVLQFHAPDGEQFYTTPIKTYHVPKTWPQTTYLTGGVTLALLNITSDEPVYYRVGAGEWTRYDGPLEVAAILARDATPTVLRARLGKNGPVLSRTLVMNPAAPAPDERHGYMLWADDEERVRCIEKLHTIEPFASSYRIFRSSFYMGSDATFGDARGGWRSGASMASKCLNNALVAVVEGVKNQPDLAALAKKRLMRLARLEAVGFENGVSSATPSKDYLNELGQTLQLYADAGVAYDLLAGAYRSSDDPAGMTPIEERWIRDGLAEVAKTMLQFRDNWSFTSGGGDVHWAHGYELALGIIAAAMPTYSTPYFGESSRQTPCAVRPPAEAARGGASLRVDSGGDAVLADGTRSVALGIIAAAMPTYSTPYFGESSRHTPCAVRPPAEAARGGASLRVDSGGDAVLADGTRSVPATMWNPFPDQGVTWWQAANDPAIPTPGHPNVRAPLRAEFLLSDSGWWTGPNDLVGDGDRYFRGPMGRRLVDVKYGGLANAEALVELKEMGGYESPFVDRLHVLEFLRRVRGTGATPQCVATYIRRRQLSGTVDYAWDEARRRYTPGEPRFASTLLAFNDHFPGAAMPGTRKNVGAFLNDVKRFYQGGPGDASERIEDDRKVFYNAYTLTLCWTPEQLAPAAAGTNDHAPILRPIFKYVTRPGQTIVKPLSAVDLDDQPVTLAVRDLPEGAVFDSKNRTITWTPGEEDLGVHIVTVSASDGQHTTSRPLPIIVMSTPGKGPVPASPSDATVVLNGPVAELSWQAPSEVEVSHYVVYKDGLLVATPSGGRTSWRDAPLPPGSHTRYHVALYDAAGHESVATATTPAVVSIPPGASAAR